ncbi:MAG: hypothetical protein IH623_15870 [Verrucomicrobia bacterium]|nr:hypothetical protein [Verrucomicrobiota bacterium]
MSADRIVHACRRRRRQEAVRLKSGTLPPPYLGGYIRLVLRLTLVIFAFTCAPFLPAQEVNSPIIISSNAQPPTVGIEGQLVVILPEAGLTAAKAERLSPVHLRIALTRPHGTLTHYDLRYIGRVPGEFDLREHLVGTNGLPATNLPPLLVSVSGVLPEDHNGWLEEQTVSEPSLWGGYRGISIVAVVLWIIAFFVILRLDRKPKSVAPEVVTQRTPTFAERLRPLIDRAAAGKLSADDKALLERMLITHWQRRLGLAGKDGDEVIATLRQHPEAGPLLQALEDWLHRPPGSVKVDVESFLAPYRNLPAEEPVEAVP